MSAGWGAAQCTARDATGDACILPGGHVGNHLTALQREGQAATPAAQPATPAANGQAQLGGIVGLLVVGALVLYAMGIIRVPGVSTPLGAPVVNTWTRSANFTTCTQWLTEMTSDQRRAMAGDLLPVLRSTVDTVAGDGAELLPTFVDAVSDTCRSPDIGDPDDYVVTAAAALTFTLDKRFQP